MGTFYTQCVVENHIDRSRKETLRLLVDTGSENTWIAESTLGQLGISTEKKGIAFQMADGRIITREIGFAVIRVGERLTIDEVVFAKPGDLELLGARTLEGLNLTVDAARKRLVSAGPLPAASILSVG